MTTIGLVGCAAGKLRRPAPARELYISPLFKKASAYAEAHSDQWFVLSAKYGLLFPDAVIPPYNLKFGDRLAPPIHDWAKDAATSLRAELVDVEEVELLILAGAQYRTVLLYLPKEWKRTVPMRGMGIGEQLGFLTQELDTLQKNGVHA